MAYQERGSGPPHFDGKNYQMWSKRMTAFLRGKGQILWDVTVDTGYGAKYQVHGAKYQVTNLSVDGGYLNVTSMLNDSSSSDDEMLIYHTMNGEFGADIREDIMKGFSEFSQEFDIRMRWAVTNLTCESASQRSTTYACISAHSECV
jgi:hypothetical protein